MSEAPSFGKAPFSYKDSEMPPTDVHWWRAFEMYNVALPSIRHFAIPLRFAISRLTWHSLACSLASSAHLGSLPGWGAGSTSFCGGSGSAGGGSEVAASVVAMALEVTAFKVTASTLLHPEPAACMARSSPSTLPAKSSTQAGSPRRPKKRPTQGWAEAGLSTAGQAALGRPEGSRQMTLRCCRPLRPQRTLHCKVSDRPMYRVTVVVAHLGWVDLDLGYSALLLGSR